MLSFDNPGVLMGRNRLDPTEVVMLLRFITAALICCVPLVSGCATCADGIGRPAPALKFCKGSRLITELGWFYADVQDTIFGVDYYADMDRLYDGDPYKD